jgi:GlpG protein
MRQIGLLPDPELARTFTDYLYTLSIPAQVMPEGCAWAVWICDEDHVARGRDELRAFESSPADPRYAQAARAARALRRQEELAEEAHARRREITDEEETEEPAAPTPGPAPRPWTMLLVFTCVGVALVSNFGEDETGPLMQALFIAPFHRSGDRITWEHLDRLIQGEYWRLITPIFLHFGFLHLIFNMMLLASLGGMIEEKRGALRYLLLIVVLAAASNLAEYYFSLSLREADVIKFEPNPLFGGMSGVLYGLFGYAWMKSRFEPSLGLDVSPLLAASLLVWFFLCLTGVFRIPVANVAHAVGLVLGLAIGYAPTLWRSLRSR